MGLLDRSPAVPVDDRPRSLTPTVGRTRRHGAEDRPDVPRNVLAMLARRPRAAFVAHTRHHRSVTAEVMPIRARHRSSLPHGAHHLAPDRRQGDGRRDRLRPTLSERDRACEVTVQHSTDGRGGAERQRGGAVTAARPGGSRPTTPMPRRRRCICSARAHRRPRRSCASINMFFVRCSTECYEQRQKEIGTVVSSFTVRPPRTCRIRLLTGRSDGRPHLQLRQGPTATMVRVGVARIRAAARHWATRGSPAAALRADPSAPRIRTAPLSDSHGGGRWRPRASDGPRAPTPALPVLRGGQREPHFVQPPRAVLAELTGTARRRRRPRRLPSHRWRPVRRRGRSSDPSYAARWRRPTRRPRRRVRAASDRCVSRRSSSSAWSAASSSSMASRAASSIAGGTGPASPAYPNRVRRQRTLRCCRGRTRPGPCECCQSPSCFAVSGAVAGPLSFPP